MDITYTGNGARLSLFLKITERVLTCGPTFGPTRTIDGSTCGPTWKKSCPYHQLARLRADAFPRNRGRVRSDNTCHSGVQRREHAPQSCIFRCPQQAKTPPRETHTWRTPKRVQFSRVSTTGTHVPYPTKSANFLAFRGCRGKRARLCKTEKTTCRISS